MRRGALGLVGALVVLGRVAHAAPTPEVADGFDHVTHPGRLAAAGVALPCTGCHRVDRAGRALGALGHATCFGRCHGEPPPARGAGPRGDRARGPIEPARREICAACHAPAALGRLERGATATIARAPVAAVEHEFALALSHRAHAGVGRGCRRCHGVPGVIAEPPRGHAGCAACHAGANAAAPAMDACERCHSLAVGARLAPHLVPGATPIAFDHRRHLARGAACATCHAAIASADGDELVAPAKPACAGCHDGARAFSLVAARCRACHLPPAAPRPAAPLVPRRFRHGSHAAAVADCARCHAGAGAPARLDHAACGEVACHADDFAALEPVTCGACHVAAAPWTPQHLDPPLRGAAELAVAFSHRAHAGRGVAVAGCAACHPGAGEVVAAATHDHRSCRGAGCHAESGGPGPTLAACTGCHRTRASPPPAPPRASVAARFRHGPHRRDRAGAPIACSTCHLTDGGAGDLARPAKARCAPCHDGHTAFGLTGHACARCHGPAPGTAASAAR